MIAFFSHVSLLKALGILNFLGERERHMKCMIFARLVVSLCSKQKANIGATHKSYNMARILSLSILLHVVKIKSTKNDKQVVTFVVTQRRG